MRIRIFNFILIVLALGAWGFSMFRETKPAINPDPNHTHADFVVWIDGQALDFSDPDFMSSSEAEETDDKHEEHGHQHHAYLHLHDGIGTVIHRHKPGLSVGEFFTSIGYTFTPTCFYESQDEAARCTSTEKKLQMFVNGQEVLVDPKYIFEDVDQILLTYGANEEQIIALLEEMPDDACLYSRTCPKRGDPPAENCIADPSVPCVAPLD